jgi:hypothetical protein
MKNQDQNVVTVSKLRKEGYKVRVSHYRPFSFFDTQEETYLLALFPFSKNKKVRDIKETAEDALNRSIYDFNLINTSGSTFVEITTPDGEELSGIAHCSHKENFCYKKGVETAIEKAFTGVGE